MKKKGGMGKRRRASRGRFQPRDFFPEFLRKVRNRTVPLPFVGWEEKQGGKKGGLGKALSFLFLKIFFFGGESGIAN